MKNQFSVGQKVAYVTLHGYNDDMTQKTARHIGTVTGINGEMITVKFDVSEFSRTLKFDKLQESK